MRHSGFTRMWRHLFNMPWCVRRHFDASALARITRAIQASETGHSGEIRFVVEGDLHPWHILHGKSPRARALELFAQLGIWDTAHNNGVLIYLLLADRDVEIVADRGIHAQVGNAQWEAICHDMEAAFRRGEFEAGVLLGIDRIGALLAQHFPASGSNPNELPDQPVVL